MADVYCKRCGRKFSSVRIMANTNCEYHPDGHHKGKCSLYEGEEKDKYTCKYCGREFRTIRNMVITNCRHHPDGAYKGKCSPAL